MNVNSLSSQEIYQQYFSGSIATASGNTGMIGGTGGGNYMPRDTMEISTFGQFMSGLRSEFGNSDVGKSIQSYFKEAIASIRSGDFDPAAAAEEAPAELKAFAEESGINLEDFLNSMKNEVESMGNRPAGGVMGPPPPPPGMNAGQTKTNIEELKSFFDSIKTAVKDGSFEPADFIESVPEDLQDFADKMGISLQDLLQDIGNRIAAKTGIPQE